MMTPCLTLAQKTKEKTVRQELSQARSLIKSAKYADVEKLLKPLLKDSANRENRRIYQAWFDAVRGQYDQANERMYLKQKQDTAEFFNITRRLFTVAEALDSVEMRPDQKGRVVMESRTKHSAQLHPLRANLFGAGNFHLRKSNWQEAFDYMETYIDCARQPLFSVYAYDSTDSRMPEAAYWATYAGYKKQDAVLTLRYRHLALRDSARAAFTLQYVAEARRWLNDDELYLATLQEGFRRFPQFSYFFPRLVDYYNARGQYNCALAVADSALVLNDSSTLYLFAKSSALLQLQRYGECINYSEKLISINDSLPEVYYNAGTAYAYIAERFAGKRERKQMRANYQKAQAHMERYRALKPDELQKWGPALYRIYLNLNLGKQFDEIDRLLKEK